MDDSEFQTLRDAPLHRLTPEEWQDWYPRMVTYLRDSRTAVREAAVERLMMGVFRSDREGCGNDDREASDTIRRRRAAWLLQEAESALRWHGDEEPFAEVLLPWFQALRRRNLDGIPSNLVEGIEILVGGLRWDGGSLPPLLDHPSNWVRGCAACALGRGDSTDPQDDGRIDPHFLAALTAKELERPGLAGPFWSGCGYFGEDPGFDAVKWMLDIVERRSGPEPGELPFNGIDFHIHEMAAGDPDAIRRLARAGRLDIALEAATELRGRVEGMAPVLHELAANDDPAVAHAARAHLAHYHGEWYPRADPERLWHRPNWKPGANLFAIRWTVRDPWSGVLVVFPAGREPFDDGEAWELIDAVVPPGQRGKPARHPLAGEGDGTGPVRFGGSEMHAYGTGVRIDLSSTSDAGLWSRIEIAANGAWDRWPPFGRDEQPETRAEERDGAENQHDDGERLEEFDHAHQDALDPPPGSSRR